MDNQSNKYYNPPNEIISIGRKLENGSWDDLQECLNPDEVLIGLYKNQNLAKVATLVYSYLRMDEIERLWSPIEYYAVDRLNAENGFNRI